MQRHEDTRKSTHSASPMRRNRPASPGRGSEDTHDKDFDVEDEKLDIDEDEDEDEDEDTGR